MYDTVQLTVFSPNVSKSSRRSRCGCQSSSTCTPARAILPVFRQMRWTPTPGHRRAASTPCSYAAGTCVFHETTAAAHRHTASTRTSSRRSLSDSPVAAAAARAPVRRPRYLIRRSKADSSRSPVRHRAEQTAACEPDSGPPTVSQQTTTHHSLSRTYPAHRVDRYHTQFSFAHKRTTFNSHYQSTCDPTQISEDIFNISNISN